MTEEKQLPTTQISTSAMSKLILKGDLSQLSEVEKIDYYKYLCERLGLDPATRPFDYLILNGKQVLYLNKGGAEQLNNVHDISIGISSTRETGSVYIVNCRATKSDGRYAEATGVVEIANLHGNNLCNAMMRGETKAARRATIRLLGLAMLDETEAKDIPGAEIKEANLIVDAETGEIKTTVSKEELNFFLDKATEKGFTKAQVREIIYNNFKEVRPNNINETLTHDILAKTMEILNQTCVVENNED